MIEEGNSVRKKDRSKAAKLSVVHTLERMRSAFEVVEWNDVGVVMISVKVHFPSRN